MARTAPVTLDTLRQAVPDVVSFLRALESVTPGRVPDELLAELDGIARNNLGLELLARAMNTPAEGNGAPVPPSRW